MTGSLTAEELLLALFHVTARSLLPEDELRKVVVSRGAGKKQLKAYNLCNGSRTQGEIAMAAGIDSGNFSRTVTRWVSSGVVFRMGAGRDAKLLHVYPLKR